MIMKTTSGNKLAIFVAVLVAGSWCCHAQGNSNPGSTPKGQIVALLNALDNLYGPPPPGLTPDKASALNSQRAQAKLDLVQKLAALGPGGAQAISDSYKQSGVIRDRLILAEALGAIEDSNAVTVLQNLLAGETDFFHRQKLINSLAHRSESAAVNSLVGITTGNDPGGLKFAAVQGLSGRPGALATLDAIIENPGDMTVRLEAIRSVGRIGTDAARLTLAGIAQKTSLDTIIRQTAIQELRRSFGLSALDVLQKLTNDPDPAIRDTASQALAMLNH
jgi:HEAT repeat protein